MGKYPLMRIKKKKLIPNLMSAHLSMLQYPHYPFLPHDLAMPNTPCSSNSSCTFMPCWFFTYCSLNFECPYFDFPPAEFLLIFQGPTQMSQCMKTLQIALVRINLYDNTCDKSCHHKWVLSKHKFPPLFPFSPVFPQHVAYTSVYLSHLLYIRAGYLNN